MKPLPKILILIIIGCLLVFKIDTDNDMVYNNFIILEAQHTPHLIKNRVLADQMTEFDIKLYDLAYKIIECESQWDATAQNETSTAYGLGQFLDGTWDYVQKKWNMRLDRKDPSDQMYATIRLLKEESWKHWVESKSCWDKNNEY